MSVSICPRVALQGCLFSEASLVSCLVGVKRSMSAFRKATVILYANFTASESRYRGARVWVCKSASWGGAEGRMLLAEDRAPYSTYTQSRLLEAVPRSCFSDYRIHDHTGLTDRTCRTDFSSARKCVLLVNVQMTGYTAQPKCVVGPNSHRYDQARFFVQIIVNGT